jgi:hypothetical protein
MRAARYIKCMLKKSNDKAQLQTKKMLNRGVFRLNKSIVRSISCDENVSNDNSSNF